MSSATDYLRQALQALEQERANLDQQIEVIARTLAELTPQELPLNNITRVVSWPEGFTPGFMPVKSVFARPVVDVALDLARDRGVFTMDELMEELATNGNRAQRASVSSVLSRLVTSGSLAKGPRRGTFARVDPDGDDSGSVQVANPLALDGREGD